MMLMSVKPVMAPPGRRSWFAILAIAVCGLALAADAKTKKVKAAAGEGDDTVTHKVRSALLPRSRIDLCALRWTRCTNHCGHPAQPRPSPARSRKTG